MFYMPKYFKAEEIFPKSVIVANHGKMDQIWRLMDDRVLWTLDMLRGYFGTAVCNLVVLNSPKRKISPKRSKF